MQSSYSEVQVNGISRATAGRSHKLTTNGFFPLMTAERRSAYSQDSLQPGLTDDTTKAAAKCNLTASRKFKLSIAESLRLGTATAKFQGSSHYTTTLA
jgi:hypothetical protein